MRLEPGLRGALALALGGAGAMLGAGAAQAACDTIAGEVIYEDFFADDYGGWDIVAPYAQIVPPALLVDPGANGSSAHSLQVLTFAAGEGVFCADMAMPLAPDGNRIAVGLVFWAQDYSNYFLFQIDTQQQASLWKLTATGGWTTLVPLTVTPALNVTPGASNEVRVTVEGQLLTMAINGTEVRKLRAQRPQGELRFGVYTQLDAPATLTEPVRVTQFRVVAPAPGG